METSIYWLDIDADRTGLEIRVNDVPAERLLSSHGINFPINEYLVAGHNHFDVRPAFPSNGTGEDAGKVSARIKCLTGIGGVTISDNILFEQTSSFTGYSSGTSLISGSFEHHGATHLNLEDLDQPDAAQSQALLDELSRIAQIWRNGDGAAATLWMARYISDYCKAYPLESPASMASAVARMAETLKTGQVEFDPSSVKFALAANGRLVECLSDQGSAVRVKMPEGPIYDTWAVFGFLERRPILIR